MKIKKILIIGGSGLIGNRFGITFPKNIFIKTYFSKKINDGIYFDINKDSISKIIKNNENFSHIMFLGGIFNFDKINNNEEEAKYINVKRSQELLLETKNLGLCPIFFSSESVFDGKIGFYSEDDIPNPIFNYAKQKIEVEDYIKKNFEEYIIFRLAKVYSFDSYKGTLITSWLKKIHINENIFCAEDNIFSPIFIDDVIIFVEKIIELDLHGIFNLSSSKPLRRIEMLNYVVNRYNLFNTSTSKIEGRPLHSFAGAKELPLNTSLNPEKIIKYTGIYPRDFDKVANSIIVKFLNIEENNIKK